MTGRRTLPSAKERRWDAFVRVSAEEFRRQLGHGADAHRLDDPLALNGRPRPLPVRRELRRAA